jgi:hypothetical protein
MRFSMRFALLAGLLVCAACSDDHHDHASGGKGGSGEKLGDAGVADSGSPPSTLDRPGSLPRPPKNGLPAELRPPR